MYRKIDVYYRKGLKVPYFFYSTSFCNLSFKTFCFILKN